MATGEMDINDVTLTVAAIEGITAQLSNLTAQLLGANATILFLSQEAPYGNTRRETDGLAAAYRTEAAICDEIDALQEIQQKVADDTADGDTVMYYAQAGLSESAAPEQTVDDL